MSSFFLSFPMTEITELYIGNRQSGKTKKLIESLSHNIIKDPHAKHIIFSKDLTLSEVYTRLPSFRKPRISLSPYFSIEKLHGIGRCFIYLDELDIADKTKASNLVNNLSIAHPIKVHVNTSPLFLRDKKDLNTNHTHSRDPLIKILQITDFNFHFLFNPKTARFYHSSFFSTNRQLFYTEGLGMISLFD